MCNLSRDRYRTLLSIADSAVLSRCRTRWITDTRAFGKLKHLLLSVDAEFDRSSITSCTYVFMSQVACVIVDSARSLWKRTCGKARVSVDSRSTFNSRIYSPALSKLTSPVHRDDILSSGDKVNWSIMKKNLSIKKKEKKSSIFEAHCWLERKLNVKFFL